MARVLSVRAAWPWVLGAVLVTFAGRAWSAPSPRGDTGGFRMEGDPKIETVFGDAEQYKQYVDRFYALYDEMRRTREDFSRNLQTVLASLAAHQGAAARGPARCPADAVAVAYARAFRAGQTFHRLGKELEASYVSIRDLDALGDTSALTPDYRWKVARVFKVYAEILRDFREMKASFTNQLAAEVKFHGCEPAALIAKGDELEEAGAPPTAPAARIGSAGRLRPGSKQREPLPPPVQASTATFFVDNASCPSSLRVYLDGALLGEVGSSSKAAFQGLVGRHELCLIPSSSRQQCGDLGTLRKTYIHDGWSITLRCD